MDIRISIDDKEVLSALDRLARSVIPAGIRTAMKGIGEVLTESTKRRFETSTDPEGHRWKGLAESTALARLTRIGKKTPSTKPLVDTRELSLGIRYQTIDAGVEIGTNRSFGKGVGAEVHQFGTRSDHVPARPFLGLSASDKTAVLDILARFLEDQIRR